MTGNGDSNRSSSSHSLGNYDDNDDNSERKRNQPAATTPPQSVDGSKSTISLRTSSSFLELENKISKEVPQNRPNEIYESRSLAYQDFATLLLSKCISSTLVVSLYHLSSCLNTCTEAFLLLAEPYLLPILSLNLDLSLSTWYCAIIRLPTIFSSSRSRFSSSIWSLTIIIQTFSVIC
jgi:hypothetical protein